MALGKINEWLEKDKLILLEGWARDGLTDEQKTKNIRINTATLYKKKKKEEKKKKIRLWARIKSGKKKIS